MNAEEDLIDQGVSAKEALPLFCMKLDETFRHDS